MSFDFWLGTWRGTWEDGEGTNHVTAEYGGHVVYERFSAEGLNGMSVSVFDEGAQLWRQTWVDDTGNYLDFTGGWRDDAMVLCRVAGTFRQRMVWHRIEPGRFEWLWQRSEGDEWATRWQIDYERIA